MTETNYSPWPNHWPTWIARIAAHLQSRQAHPARTVVLLPFAQLMPVAARQWAQAYPTGFAPRFETTMSWSRSLGMGMGLVGQSESDATRIAFDTALDVLTSRTLLEQAGLTERAEALAPRLVEVAHQLGPLAAAVHPTQRVLWASQSRVTAQMGMEGPALALEALVAQTAVAWAANSAYATDILFEPEVREVTDALIVLQGLQPDPLMASLQTVWAERLCTIAMDEISVHPELVEGSKSESGWCFHPTRDAQDEAQRAAACVLQHVNAGRTPVALVANDRALTRRIRAMLEGSGLRLRDETGWKLSTSRAAAHVMGALRACVWNASTDSVIDWLKNAPTLDAAAIQTLEAQLRRHPVREWRLYTSQLPELIPLLTQVNTWRDDMQRTRTLPQWQAALQTLLERSGQWAPLQLDAAGTKLLAALRLGDQASPEWQALLAQASWAPRRMSLTAFTQWVNQALEAASFTPDYPDDEQVVILPLSQMLARSFKAMVMPGCDEARFSPSPEPPGVWTPTQRLALGLPTREQLTLALQAAWQQALQTPCVDLLWRESDDGGETLLPSPLVQLLRLQAVLHTRHSREGGNPAQAQRVEQALDAPDPRPLREVWPTPLIRPAPAAPALSLQRVSASAYSDLRRCPYRYFALQLLGLKEADEMEADLDKRDFGLWLHAVLKQFHDQLQDLASADAATLLSLLDAAADQTTQSQGLAEDEFLPFMAAWPGVRDGYLVWLQKHQTEGARFDVAEQWLELALGPLTLVGRVDRIDKMHAPGSGHDVQDVALVIDYKTESLGVTRDRIKTPLEDTQLAFYAALLPHDTLRAAYVNVGEKTGTALVEQADVVHVRDALVEGLLHDMERIAEGALLPALGEGTACEFCAARGLCRKDFWRLS